jgi:hypothetical protein
MIYLTREIRFEPHFWDLFSHLGTIEGRIAVGVRHGREHHE